MTEDNKDIQLLLKAMENLGAGSFKDIDRDEFDNPALADAFNDMLEKVMARNNAFLARINDAMIRIGNASNIKALYEQISHQDETAKALTSARNSFGNVLSDTLNSADEALTIAREIRSAFEPTSLELSDAADEIADSYAALTDLKDNMKELSDDIMRAALKLGSEHSDIVHSLSHETAAFTSTYEAALQSLNHAKNAVSISSDLMQGGKRRLVSIINNVSSIHSDTTKQSEMASRLLKTADTLASSYSTISMTCFNEGRHLYRISRDIDCARNDMYRQNTKNTVHDCLRVFEVDHLTLSWRIYNHIVEFEQLKITQVNNPGSCKFGLWIKNQTDPVITESEAFKQSVDAHNKLHLHAVASFEAKEAFNIPLAVSEFELVLTAFEEFKAALTQLHAHLSAHGITAETPIWKFSG